MHRSHCTFIRELAKAGEKLARDQQPSSKKARRHRVFSEGAWFTRFAVGMCSSQCLLLLEPSDSATARRWHQICTDTDIPALGWTRTPPRRASHAHWDHSLRSSPFPQNPGWMPGQPVTEPFRGAWRTSPGQHICLTCRITSGCFRATAGAAPELKPKPASRVRTINTPYDHQSALWEWPWRFTTSGAIYSTVPQKE